jgi:hypothetical protein
VVREAEASDLLKKELINVFIWMELKEWRCCYDEWIESLIYKKNEIKILDLVFSKIETTRRTQILVFPTGTGGQGSGMDTGNSFEKRSIVVMFCLFVRLVDWLNFIGVIIWICKNYKKSQEIIKNRKLIYFFLPPFLFPITFSFLLFLDWCTRNKKQEDVRHLLPGTRRIQTSQITTSHITQFRHSKHQCITDILTLCSIRTL